MKTKIWIVAALILGCAQLSVHAQKAQGYPDRAIKLVVPFATGGPTDTVARVVGLDITKSTGKPVVVENRPGAGGVLGADFVAKSPPDGYTLLLCSAGAMAINQHLMPNMPYVPLRDLQPVVHVVSIPYLLLVSAKSPVHSLGDLITRAKASPGGMNAGSAGTGSTSHLAMVLLNNLAQVNVVHVPYKGSSQSDSDLIAGSLDMTFSAVPSALALVKSNRLRALAVADAHRLASLPDVPTMAEAGLPGFEVSTWLGICAPSATPPDVVAELNRIVVKGATSAESRKTYAGIGGEVVAGPPQQFRTFIEGEQKKWGEVIQSAGIKVNK